MSEKHDLIERSEVIRILDEHARKAEEALSRSIISALADHSEERMSSSEHHRRMSSYLKNYFAFLKGYVSEIALSESPDPAPSSPDSDLLPISCPICGKSTFARPLSISGIGVQGQYTKCNGCNFLCITLPV